MDVGTGGKYEQECKLARMASGGETVLLIVFDGCRGTGFSICSVGEKSKVLPAIPEILRLVAFKIEQEKGT